MPVPEDPRAAVEATPNPPVGFLEITATRPTPREADLLSQTFADELMGYVKNTGDQRIASQTAKNKQQIERLTPVVNQLLSDAASTDPTIAANARAKLSQPDNPQSELTGLVQQQQQLDSEKVAGPGLEIVQSPHAAEVPQTGFNAPRARWKFGMVLSLLSSTRTSSGWNGYEVSMSPAYVPGWSAPPVSCSPRARSCS